MRATLLAAVRAGDASGPGLLANSAAWWPSSETAHVPPVVVGWTRGLMLPEWTAAPHGSLWCRATESDDALAALMAPLFALGLLALPREARADALKTAPPVLEAAARAAFLKVREVQRPPPAVIALAGRLWSAALPQLRHPGVPDRVRVVSAVVSILGSQLAWELDALCGAPVVLTTVAVEDAAPQLANWWLGHLAGAAA